MTKIQVVRAYHRSEIIQPLKVFEFLKYFQLFSYAIIEALKEELEKIQPDIPQVQPQKALDPSKFIKPYPVQSCPDLLKDRKSIFQGHICIVKNRQEAIEAVEYLKSTSKKIATATHNITAYRIMNPITKKLEKDCDDDGETAAGKRLLHLLDLLKVETCVVIVTRWYGGIHLGPDRFKHINNCARDTLKYFKIVE